MSTAEFHRIAGAALAAVSVSDDYDLSWFGESVDTIRPLPEEEMMVEAAASFVSRLLYRGFYLFGWPRRDLAAFRESVMEGLPSTRSARFVNAAVYAGARVGNSTMTLPVTELHGQPIIDLDGARVRLSLPDHQAHPHHVEVHIPAISVTKSPGFVLFRSPHGQPCLDGQRLVRLYWNLTATGALDLITPLTHVLDERGMGYHFKVVHADAEWPDRADSAVLYIGHRDLASTWPALREIHGRLLPKMRPYVPAMTRRIGLGLGVAEDPGRGESYGMFVCAMIADGLMRAHAERCADPTRRLEYVADAFASKGRSLDTPYAGAEVARTVVHALSGAASPLSSRATSVPSSADRSQPPTEDELVAHAERLARRMAGDALWHEDRCTWLKPHPDVAGRNGWVPMTADVYDGTAGMALFFAQLAAFTSDRSYADLARAASMQALATAADLPGVGLYSGTSGVGLAVALAGRALGETSLSTLGCELVEESARRARVLAADGPVPFDVIDGVAGALLGALGAHALGSPGSLELAAAMGTLLVSLGGTDPSGGLYWRDPIREDTLGFIGFAHGAAGCALALAELGRESGDPAFLDAAERACRYERTWYDKAPENWRDVRTIHERGADGDATLEPDVHRYDWCYGAPGIALSRTGLFGVGGVASAEVAHDARVGFAETRRAGELFPLLAYDMCVCHGAAGLAEILSLAPEEFTGDGDARIARVLTHHALVSHDNDLAWPHGHGLMLGASGVALAALRRVDPAIVSPLLLLPQRYGDTHARHQTPKTGSATKETASGE